MDDLREFEAIVTMQVVFRAQVIGDAVDRAAFEADIRNGKYEDQINAEAVIAPWDDYDFLRVEIEREGD